MPIAYGAYPTTSSSIGVKLADGTPLGISPPDSDFPAAFSLRARASFVFAACVMSMKRMMEATSSDVPPVPLNNNTGCDRFRHEVTS